MTTLSNIITPSNVLTTTNTATVTNKTLTSPTVTGMVVSDGTASGVTYLNGSKVLTSGSALTFDGTTLVSSSSAPGTVVSLARLLNTGTTTGTTSRLLFTNNTDGAGGAVSAAIAHIAENTTGGGTLGFYTPSTGSPVLNMQLTGAGNLGLGVTPLWAAGKGFEIGSNGNALASVNSTQTTISQNAYHNGTNWTYARTSTAVKYQQYAGTHTWQTAASGTAGNAITFTDAMTLDASGNLAVGTTSASGILHVNGVQDAVAGKNARFSYSGTYYLEVNEQSIRSFNNPLIFGSGTSGAERARILSSGEFLVSATSSFGVGVTIYTPDSGGSYSNATSTAARNHWRFANANGAVGSIQTSASATSYNTSSDYRLKNTIAPMTGALAKVAQLKPCIYKWNADGADGEGFIAHELAEVCPQAVTGEKDAVDADGKPVYQGIDVSFLVATLTSALQELNAKFEAYVASHP